VVQNFHQRQSNFAVPTKHKEKNFSFYFKCYNLTIREVNFCKTFCTCSPNSLGQDPTFEITKKFLKDHFGVFFEKKGHDPLGIKASMGKCTVEKRGRHTILRIFGVGTKLFALGMQ
jgi:hypothetical protein